jgi:hypothetical protein
VIHGQRRQPGPGGIFRDLFGLRLLYQLWVYICEIPPTFCRFGFNEAIDPRWVLERKTVQLR